MSKNNHVELTGNMGTKARIIEREGKSSMAAFSLATQDSYKDKAENWQSRAPIWHNILSFNASDIEKLKELDKGARIRVRGSLSYKQIKAITDKGKQITVKEAAIIASGFELAPITPK